MPGSAVNEAIGEKEPDMRALLFKGITSLEHVALNVSDFFAS